MLNESENLPLVGSADRGLFIGVEAQPGCKAHAKICNERGVILAFNDCGIFRGQGDVKTDATAARGVIDTAIHLEKFNLDSKDVRVIVVAIGGPDDPYRRQQFAAMLKKQWLYGDVRIEVYPDLEVAMGSIAPSGPGLVNNAGDCDREYVRNRAGEKRLTLGSNSGHHVAWQAIYAAIESGKDLGPATMLVPRFQHHFGVDDARDLPEAFEFVNQTERTQVLNDVLKMVSEEAEDGDPVSAKLCSSLAYEIAGLSVATVKSFGIESEPIPVCLFGGIWELGVAFRQPYISAMRDVAPFAYSTSNSIDLSHTAAKLAIEMEMGIGF